MCLDLESFAADSDPPRLQRGSCARACHSMESIGPHGFEWPPRPRSINRIHLFAAAARELDQQRGDAKKVALYAPRYVRLELAAADAQDNGEEDEVEVGHRTRTSNPQLQSIAFLPFRRSALAGEEEGDRREKPIFPRRRRRLFSRQTEQRPRTDGRAGGRDTARKVLRREATGSYTRAGEGKGGRKGLKTGRKNVGRGTCCEGPWSGLQYFPLSQSHFRYIQF